MQNLPTASTDLLFHEKSLEPQGHIFFCGAFDQIGVDGFGQINF